MLGKFTAGDFIAIAGEMCRFPASNENTEWGDMFICGPVVSVIWPYKNPTKRVGLADLIIIS